jgi:AAA15 family ATPase/GTPase
MLTRLDLKYFKCFERLHLPLAELTLLTGTNASGKSSVLQALVLLHQTMQEHEWSNRLMLNGDSIKLGTVSDVVDKVHGRTTFEIGLLDNDQEILWSFIGERSEMSMAVDSVFFNKKLNLKLNLSCKFLFISITNELFNSSIELEITKLLVGLTMKLLNLIKRQ